MQEPEADEDLLTQPYEIREPFEKTVLAGCRPDHRWFWVSGLSAGTEVYGFREPWNLYDGNAVALYDSSGNHLGYLTKTFAQRFAPVLDRSVGVARVRFLINGRPQNRKANLITCVYGPEQAEKWDRVIEDLRVAMDETGWAELNYNMFGGLVRVGAHRELNVRLAEMVKELRGSAIDLRVQLCPACGRRVYWGRYPGRLCDGCLKRTTSKDGQAVEFFEKRLETLELGARYVETWEEYESDECFVDGVRCVANIGQWGGVVVQAVAEGSELIVRSAEALTGEGSGVGYFATFGDDGEILPEYGVFRFVGRETPEFYDAGRGKWIPSDRLLSWLSDGMGSIRAIDKRTAERIVKHMDMLERARKTGGGMQGQHQN